MVLLIYTVSQQKLTFSLNHPPI